MEVTILKGANTAMDARGNVHHIEALEITRESTKAKLYYNKDTSFYRAAVFAGLKSTAYLKDGRLILT